MDRLSDGQPTQVGIDHGFSFPQRYFDEYQLRHDWPAFLDDFHSHWPTGEDHTYVEFVRDGACGKGKGPCGNAHWRRLTEHRAGAKSVFHFDVQGSVAKSTPARTTLAKVYPLSSFERLGRAGTAKNTRWGGTFSRSRSLPVPLEQRLREAESGTLTRAARWGRRGLLSLRLSSSLTAT